MQGLALLLHRAADGPALVVAPKSVCAGWVSEAQRFAPTLRLHRLARATDRAGLVQSVGAGDVIVCSYGLLTSNADLLGAVEWSTVVLDEAQHIKNASTKRAAAAFGLQARFRLACTGTPIENRLSELWSLFRFLNPGLLGSERTFGQTWRIPIEQSGDREARASLRRRRCRSCSGVRRGRCSMSCPRGPTSPFA
ncbi:MAG: SNF2 family DNA or RNA helicase [Myxococcota bacterium]